MKLNFTNLEYYKKRYSFLFNKKTVVAILAVFLILVLVLNYIYRVPEFELSKQYIKTNHSIEEYFGEIIEVKKGKGGSHVEWNLVGQYPVEGFYSFFIDGRKNDGEIKIYWHSKGKGEDYVVTKIEF